MDDKKKQKKVSLTKQTKQNSANRAALFSLHWPGKEISLASIKKPTCTALTPCPDLSKDFQTTNNLFLEGDNLEVMKLLTDAYQNQVQFIYMEPPFNTKQDFIAPGSLPVSFTRQEKKVADHEQKANWKHNKAHHLWLTMINPRLKLAHQLLSDRGVIFISIDDYELANLKHVCNQIFGEENCLATLVVANSNKKNLQFLSLAHEYILCYAKSRQVLRQLGMKWCDSRQVTKTILGKYKQLKEQFGDDNSKVQRELRKWYKELPSDDPSYRFRHYNSVDRFGVYASDNISPAGKKGARYSLLHPLTNKPCKVPARGWSYDQATMQTLIRDGLVLFGSSEKTVPRRKLYLSERELSLAESILYHDSKKTTKNFKSLFGSSVYSNPQSEDLIAKLIKFCALPEQSIIADFFSGSASTAHAVMKVNQETRKNYRYLMVQAAAPTKKRSVAYTKGYPTVAEIGRQRIIHAANAITQKDGFITSDLGFRYFKLAPSLLDSAGKLVTQQLEAQQIDQLVYQLLLKQGNQLTSKVEKIQLEKVDVYVANQQLAICLEPEVDDALIDSLFKLGCKHVVCLSKSLNDQQKAFYCEQSSTSSLTENCSLLLI